MFDKISELWETANAFIVNGMVCNTFSFEDVDNDDDIEDPSYISFEITTSDFKILEYYIDVNDFKDAILEKDNAVRFPSKNLVIVPLFTKKA